MDRSIYGIKVDHHVYINIWITQHITQYPCKVNCFVSFVQVIRDNLLMHYNTCLIPYQIELEEVLIDVLECRSDSDISQDLKIDITQTITNLQVMRDALEIAVRLLTELCKNTGIITLESHHHIGRFMQLLMDIAEWYCVRNCFYILISRSKISLLIIFQKSKIMSSFV